MGRRTREKQRERSFPEEKKEPPRMYPYKMEDEETGDSHDDPYVYSDDSASLNDAYFFPQSDDDLARPPLYRREQDPLQSNNQQLQNCSYYGTINSNNSNRTPSKSQQNSPLWVGGAIQEGKEHFMVPPISYNNNNAPIVGRKERKRQRRSQRMKLKQMEHAARERRVTQVKGRPQPETTWQDPVVAVIFVIQLFIVLGCTLVFGSGLIKLKAWQLYVSTTSTIDTTATLNENRFLVSLKHNITSGDVQYTDDDRVHAAVTTPKDSTMTRSHHDDSLLSFFTFDCRNVVALVCINGFYACILTYLSVGLMLILVRSLIPVMLIFSVLLTLAWGLIGLTLDPYGVISIMGFAALLATLTHTIYNWSRIPFAATNLYTALSAMRCTADITILGMGSVLVAFVWCVAWSMAFVGIINAFNNVECSEKDACNVHITYRHLPVYLLLLFSFHWTNTVIKNVVRATVASAIGTWWYYPQDISPFCTSAVGRPLIRSVTKSLGSICLGSVVIPLAQFASVIGGMFCGVFGNSDCIYQSRRDDQDLHQSHEVVVEGDSAADAVRLGSRICRLLKHIALSLRSCNRWSFTYIGMYGYSFREAGERALVLFETREWLDVVSDNLIQNVLWMASVIIGGSTGTFAVVVEETDGYYFSSLHMPIFWAFVIGSVLGYTLSNILLLGVVGSAVNTVLVLFAAGPFEFDKNHPHLSREMREVWSQQVWSPEPA